MAVRETQWRDTGRRLLTIMVGAPIVLASIVVGPPVYAILILLVSMLAAIEICQMIHPQRRVMVSVPLIVLACILSNSIGNFWLLVLALGVAALINHFASRITLTTSGYLVLGALYVGLPLSFLLPLRITPDGLWWTLVLFIANWSTDGFALTGGRLFGRHKLAPHISAGKTIEGAVIGLIMGTLLGVGTALLGHLELTHALLVSFMIAVLSIAGDLLESRVKRFFGVKDSSALLPGHGGFLDRMDGLLLALPVVYVLVVML